MRTLLKTLLLFTLFLSASCNGTQSNDPVSEPQKEKLSGVEEKKEDLAFDINGNQGTCEPMDPDKVCTEIFSMEDRFASKCRDEGHKVIQCDCHKYLCQTKDGRPMPFDPM